MDADFEGRIQELVETAGHREWRIGGTVKGFVIDLLKEQLGIDKIEMTDTLETLGADSLDCIEIEMELENEFYEVEFRDEEVRLEKDWRMEKLVAFVMSSILDGSGPGQT